MDATPAYFRGKSALITGASSGIGEELAWQLSRAGARLTIAARRKDLLDNLAQKIADSGSARPVTVECDVSRDGELERAVKEATEHWGPLHAVFANAGFGVVGSLQNLSVDDYRRQFETNVFGVLRTVYAALPEIEKTHGHIVLISSVSGWVSTPGASAYSMSKFALRALANAITPELARLGVTVTLISPGFVVSNFRRVDNQARFHADAVDTVPAWVALSTERAVQQILRATARGKREQIITLHGRLLVALERFVPWVNRTIWAGLIRKYRRRPDGTPR